MRVAKISLKDLKKNIVFFAVLNAAIYIATILAFKYFNLLHFWGLRVSNYFILTIISIYQLKSLVRNNRGYVPFLQSYFTILVTGSISFALFALFIFGYSFLDPMLAKMFITDSSDDNKLIPAIIVFFEGSGASIIAALIAMFYASRFEDGESSLPG